VTGTPLDALVPHQRAYRRRARRLDELRERQRLLPALELYDTKLLELEKAGSKAPEVDGLGTLTDIFLQSYKEVLRQIRAAGKTGIAQINAVKRSAGTNYQGLCEYAIIRWLQTTTLAVNVCPNAPKNLKDELTIYGEDTGGEFSVEPDIDICLFEEGDDPISPLMFVSAKTSLVDRAGQAARWKLYLDLHQTTCPYTKQVLDCPIHRTRVKIRTQHPIEHCIVTANIYKIDTTQPEGELRSGQCRNNTYMFRNKFTTRSDSREYRPADWRSFVEFPRLVSTVFANRVRTDSAPQFADSPRGGGNPNKTGVEQRIPKRRDP
jgi:hypothetical protein